MQIKGWAITMGIGAAVGAVAIMMAPRQSTARQLANKAAEKVEGAVNQMSDKLNQQLG